MNKLCIPLSASLVLSCHYHVNSSDERLLRLNVLFKKSPKMAGLMCLCFSISILTNPINVA